METIILKTFLLISVIVVLLPDLCGYLILRRPTDIEPNKRTRKIKRYYALWAISYLSWIAIVVLYWIDPSSVEWFGKITLLDKTPIRVFSMVVVCFGYYLLMITSVFHMFKKIKLAAGGEIPLITSGIFSFVRHPMYLSVDIGALGTFLLLPNLFSLTMAVGMIASLYGVGLEEEKNLLKVYGEEYDKYKNEVGMFFPRLKRSSEK